MLLDLAFPASDANALGFLFSDYTSLNQNSSQHFSQVAFLPVTCLKLTVEISCL